MKQAWVTAQGSASEHKREENQWLSPGALQHEHARRLKTSQGGGKRGTSERERKYQ